MEQFKTLRINGFGIDSWLFYSGFGWDLDLAWERRLRVIGGIRPVS